MNVAFGLVIAGFLGMFIVFWATYRLLIKEMKPDTGFYFLLVLLWVFEVILLSLLVTFLEWGFSL